MKILVADKIADDAIERMRGAGIDVTVKTGLTPEELLKEVPPYDAIAIRSATKVTAAVMEAAKNLKLIVRGGVGLDNVDRGAASERGIEVRNTPGATAVSVAEHVMALMLAMVRHIPQAHAKLSGGVWDKKSFMGSELFGKVLGVVGLGRIGREVARRAQAFGMEVIANDPIVDPDIACDLGTPLVPLEDLLARADHITLHMPLTDETRNLIDARRISTMKKGARLINCARGGIVDEGAVAAAVREGHLAGAAFDVYSEEPLKSSPLMGVDGVIMLPHLGASTVDGQRRAGLELADIVIEFAKRS